MKSITWAVVGAGFLGAVMGFAVLTSAADSAVSPKEKSLQAPAPASAPASCHAAGAKVATGKCPMAGAAKGGGCCSK